MASRNSDEEAPVITDGIIVESYGQWGPDKPEEDEAQKRPV